MIKSTDSPLEAAKRGKDTSMWLAIESVKKKETDTNGLKKNIKTVFALRIKNLVK